jgi:DNA mismatch repair protein MutS
MKKREDTDVDGSSPGFFSLLYPPGITTDHSELFNELGDAAQHDLGVDQIAAAFTADREQQKEIRILLSQLLCDPDMISYRQDVIEDLIRNPELVKHLESLFPVIDALVKYSFHKEKGLNSLHEVTWRIGELRNIVDCFGGLGEIFAGVGDSINSLGLRSLRDEIRTIQNDPTFQNLVRELPELLSKLRSCASITIGVNLDASLRPIQATLLSINEERFTNQSILNKLTGIKNENEGIAPLHSVPQRVVEGHYAFPVSSELGWGVEPTMVPLFADLAKVLEKTTLPIAKQLRQYTEIHSRLFINLRQGLIFYLGAVRFILRLQNQGLPVCRPRIAPQADRVCEVKDSYNVNLAFHKSHAPAGQSPAAITQNDIHTGPEGRILILTGPNQGGKTTYMQGAGLVQVLAQVGCYVPGRQARISPVDAIYTHFPLEEKPETDTGRLGEEAMRIRKIFEYVTRHSLVLLNESLSSTSFSESLYLAQDIVRMLRRVGACAIYSTHLHELGSQVDELNTSVPGESKIISVVSSPIDSGSELTPGEVRRTYKIEIRPPLGQSYAREIATRHGISYQQLEKVLLERDVLEEKDP